jgi:hypothetical protein
MVKPKILGQLSQVSLIESKLGQRLRPCLAGNAFAKVFFLFKGLFGKHLIGLF